MTGEKPHSLTAAAPPPPPPPPHTDRPRGLKVVLFCGGQGLRLRDYDHKVPKPMVPIGYRPVLWHIMRWYAHHGHRDFILALGHGADVIKRYFLDYDESVTNDFVLRPRDRDARGRRDADGVGRPHCVDLVTDDTSDWTIGFVDTGTNACIGERLRAVRPYLEGDEWFLANYADGVSDAPMNDMIALTKRAHADRGVLASFMSVRPSQTFHCVNTTADGTVESIRDVGREDLFINGGFFTLHQNVFDHLNPGEDLVGDALPRLIPSGRLLSWRHDGFFAAMDTFKEQQHLSNLHAEGIAPWEVWKHEKRRERDAAVMARFQANQPQPMRTVA